MKEIATMNQIDTTIVSKNHAPVLAESSPLSDAMEGTIASSPPHEASSSALGIMADSLVDAD
jgi:hypothetical protein